MLSKYVDTVVTLRRCIAKVVHSGVNYIVCTNENSKGRSSRLFTRVLTALYVQLRIQRTVAKVVQSGVNYIVCTTENSKDGRQGCSLGC